MKCIEHNFLTTEKTIKRMKKEGIALSCQAVMSLEAFANPESITFFSADQKAKGKRVNSGASQMFEWAVKHDLLMVTGGDMFGVADGPRQAANMTKMKDVGVTPYKIMKMGTSDAATVIGWSGEMNPYKDGAIGVIKPGAYADLVVIEGNPLENIDILLDYKNNMKLIVTDGKVWKNTLK